MATFDRPPERHSTPEGSPDDPSAPTSSIQPNEHPWRNAFAAGVPIYIITLIVLLPSSAYAAGRLIWPATLGALAAGGMAKESEKVWRWWTYLIGVAGVAAFVVGLYALTQAL